MHQNDGGEGLEESLENGSLDQKREKGQADARYSSEGEGSNISYLFTVHIETLIVD